MQHDLKSLRAQWAEGVRAPAALCYFSSVLYPLALSPVPTCLRVSLSL